MFSKKRISTLLIVSMLLTSHASFILADSIDFSVSPREYRNYYVELLKEEKEKKESKETDEFKEIRNENLNDIDEFFDEKNETELINENEDNIDDNIINKIDEYDDENSIDDSNNDIIDLNDYEIEKELDDDFNYEIEYEPEPEIDEEIKIDEENETNEQIESILESIFDNESENDEEINSSSELEFKNDFNIDNINELNNEDEYELYTKFENEIEVITESEIGIEIENEINNSNEANIKEENENNNIATDTNAYTQNLDDYNDDISTESNIALEYIKYDLSSLSELLQNLDIDLSTESNIENQIYRGENNYFRICNNNAEDYPYYVAFKRTDEPIPQDDFVAVSLNTRTDLHGAGFEVYKVYPGVIFPEGPPYPFIFVEGAQELKGKIIFETEIASYFEMWKNSRRLNDYDALIIPYCDVFTFSISLERSPNIFFENPRLNKIATISEGPYDWYDPGDVLVDESMFPAYRKNSYNPYVVDYYEIKDQNGNFYRVDVNDIMNKYNNFEYIDGSFHYVLYAVEKRDPDYTIKFDCSNITVEGSAQFDPRLVVSSNSVSFCPLDYNPNDYPIPNIISNYDYLFYGWCDHADGNGTVYFKDDIPVLLRQWGNTDDPQPRVLYPKFINKSSMSFILGVSNVNAGYYDLGTEQVQKIVFTPYNNIDDLPLESSVKSNLGYTFSGNWRYVSTNYNYNNLKNRFNLFKDYIPYNEKGVITYTYNAYFNNAPKFTLSTKNKQYFINTIGNDTLSFYAEQDFATPTLIRQDGSIRKARYWQNNSSSKKFALDKIQDAFNEFKNSNTSVTYNLYVTNMYNINFNVTDATNKGMTVNGALTYKEDDNYIIPQVQNNSSYVFKHWTLNNTTKTPVNVAEEIEKWKNKMNINSNITFYAVVEDKQITTPGKFKIEVDTNYLNVSGETEFTQDLSVSSQSIATPTITAKPGYIFNNQYSYTPGGHPIPDSEIAELFNHWNGADTTIYALYEAIPKTAKFIIDSNKGTSSLGNLVEVNSITDFNYVKATISVSTKSGYIFDGWEYNGTVYKDLSLITWDGNSDITITAKFSSVTPPSPPIPPTPPTPPTPPSPPTPGPVGPGGGGGGSGGGSGGGGGAPGWSRGNNNMYDKNNELNNLPRFVDANNGLYSNNFYLNGLYSVNNNTNVYVIDIPITPAHTSKYSEINQKKPHIYNSFINYNQDVNEKNLSWVSNDGYNWYVYDKVNKSHIRNSWAYLERSGFYNWYYFNETGLMHTGWLNDSGYYYYLDNNNNSLKGKMLTGQCLLQDGGLYSFAYNGILIQKH